MSRTPHQSALAFAAIATVAATTRQETASTEPRSASTIDSQRNNRIDHIEELWRGRAGDEADHFGRNDQEQVHQYQNREDLIRMDALHAAPQQSRQYRARSEINHRIGCHGYRVLSGLSIVQESGACVSSGSSTVTKRASSTSEMRA